jgi:hypothetical protein
MQSTPVASFEMNRVLLYVSNVIRRIESHAVETHFKMQVRAGRMSGRADSSDHIALIYLLTHIGCDTLGVTVECPPSAAVVDNAVVAVSAAAAAAVVLAVVMRTAVDNSDDSAVGSCADICASDIWRVDVDALVIRAPSPANAVADVIEARAGPCKLGLIGIAVIGIIR